MTLKICYIALAGVLLSGCLGNTGASRSTVTDQDVFEAFQDVCLNGDTTFPEWREKFSAAGLDASGGAMPQSLPSGDVVVYSEDPKRSSGTALRNCNVLVLGDKYVEAEEFLLSALQQPPWDEARRVNRPYKVGPWEAIAYSQAYHVGNGEYVQVIVRTVQTQGIGVLTALNTVVHPYN